MTSNMRGALSRLVKHAKQEHGQDLLEYAFVFALIALGASVGMQSVANGLNTAFNSMATRVTSYIT